MTACLGVSALLWDSGFGKLAAFNDEFELSGASSEEEILFGIAVVALQIGALVLILSDRWMWLGAIALIGLGVLTFPGAQPWHASEAAFVSTWAIAKHLSVFAVFILVAGMSSIRSDAKREQQAGRLPELSWRQMVLAEEVGSRYGRPRPENPGNIFDKFYSSLPGNTANG
ncbi:MAG TPA: hypothetical protein VEZ16_13370 [Microvirga sp.]|nr:hypothetical protein [Microvirga sp.]